LIRLLQRPIPSKLCATNLTQELVHSLGNLHPIMQLTFQAWLRIGTPYAKGEEVTGTAAKILNPNRP
jgi:hypothetical protein